MKRSKMTIVLLVMSLFTSITFFGQNPKNTIRKELTVEEVFKSRDKNEDGKLAKSELIGFVSNDFEKLDTDKDGFLSKDELVKSSKFQKKKTDLITREENVQV